MRLLFLNHNLAGRGTYFRCMGFARELARQGHTVDLWTVSRSVSAAGRWYEEDGVRIWQTPRWLPPGAHDGGYAPLDNLCRLGAAVWPRWDVIHAFDHRPNVLLPWLWLKAQSRLLPPAKRPVFLVDWCDWWTAGGITTARRRWRWIDGIEQRIEEGQKRMAAGVTVISQPLLQRARSIGIPDARLFLLPAGVDANRFPTYERDEARARLSLETEAPLLGFVGFSLWDLALLADIFAAVRAQRPDAKLAVIGGGAEESAIGVLRQRFAPQALVLPGVVPFQEVATWLGACDMLLLPMENNLANRARVPNKLADYYAAARPVAASDVGDTGRYIREHQTGCVGQDAQALARECLTLLEQPQRAREMGKRARAIAARDWAYENLTQRLTHFYSELISSTEK